MELFLVQVVSMVIRRRLLGHRKLRLLSESGEASLKEEIGMRELVASVEC